MRVVLAVHRWHGHCQWAKFSALCAIKEHVVLLYFYNKRLGISLWRIRVNAIAGHERSHREAAAVSNSDSLSYGSLYQVNIFLSNFGNTHQIGLGWKGREKDEWRPSPDRAAEELARKGKKIGIGLLELECNDAL